MGILKSVLAGVLLVLAACVLLFWAEGRAVNTARALEEGAGIVMSVDANQVDPANDGKLVHVSGTITAQDVPTDSRLGMAPEGAITLKRTVEMFQWKETQREVERTGSDGKTSKSTVYDYEKVWSERPIDSSRFKMGTAPKNPSMPMESETFRIDAAKLGAFRLSGNDVAPLAKDTAIPLTDDGIAKIATAYGGASPVWLLENRFVIANDPEKPDVGDIRISFERGDLDKASVVAAQRDGGLAPFTASNGREIFLIQKGTATAAEMFKDAISSNTTLTWIIRIGGLVLMFVGFGLTFKLLTGISDSIPVIGGLIRAGTSLVSLVLTMVLGSVVIAAGWIFYRPMLAFIIVAVGFAIAFATGYLGRKTAVGTPSAAPTKS